MKTCPKCKTTKASDAFYVDRSKPDGLTSYCKECCKAKEEARRLNKRDELNQKNLARYYAHHDKVLTKQKQRYQEQLLNSPDVLREKQRQQRKRAWDKHGHQISVKKQEWAARNPDRVLKSRQKSLASNPDTIKDSQRRSYERNKELVKKRALIWARQHPECKRLNYNRRRAAKLASAERITVKQWRDLCAKYDNRCLCCSRTDKLEIDHIVPISKGGTHTLNNIQPLCRSCNSRKNARTIDYRPSFAPAIPPQEGAQGELPPE